MALKITGRMKVKTLKSMFKNEFGLSLRVYDGIIFANDDDTIAKIRKKEVKGGELSIARNMKVGNVEKKIEEMFGIKVQISGSDDSYLCDNNLTLARALETDKKLMEKRGKRKDESNKTQQEKGKEVVDSEKIIEEIKKTYAGHEEIDNIIENLSSEPNDFYLTYWGTNFCDPDFPANLELAKKLFLLREKKCKNTLDFTSLAENILSGLKDKEWAISLYRKALEVQNDFRDLISIANSIANNLEDDNWAKELYEEAYAKIADLCNYVSIIKGVSRNPKNKEWAIKIVNEAIDKLNSIKNTENIFEFAEPACVLELGEFIVSEGGMNNKELAKEIFDINKSCDSITDLLDSARKVMEIYGDAEYTNQYVEDVLNKAMELVDEGYYCDIYNFIKDELGDEEKAEDFKSEYYSKMKEDYEEFGNCEEIFGTNKMDIDDIDFNDYDNEKSLVGIETKFIFDEIEEMMDKSGKVSSEGIELANEKLEEFIDELKGKLNGAMDENFIKVLVGDDVKDYEKGLVIDSVENIRGIYFVITKEIPAYIIDAIFLNTDYYFIALFKDYETGAVVIQSYYDGEYDTGYFSEGADESYTITDDKIENNKFYKWYRKLEEEITA